MIIISPEQFREVFLNVVKIENNEAELVKRLYSSKQYTDFMLDTLLPPMAAQLNLKIYREYFQIDAIFYEEMDNVNFKTAQNYAKYIITLNISLLLLSMKIRQVPHMKR